MRADSHTTRHDTTLAAIKALGTLASNQYNKWDLQAKKVKAFREFAEFSNHKDRLVVKAKLRERLAQLNGESDALIDQGLDILSAQPENNDSPKRVGSPREWFVAIDNEVANKRTAIGKVKETLLWIENLDLGFPGGIAPKRDAPMILT